MSGQERAPGTACLTMPYPPATVAARLWLDLPADVREAFRAGLASGWPTIFGPEPAATGR